ncbi:TetR/AcrR family transcriptional regulator [Blastococcus sp. SYSU DS1021]
MPRSVDPDERRRTIAEALWRVVARDGLAAATVRSVAAEAGLSLGAVTPFFDGQEALHLFAMRLVVERTAARVARLDPQGSPREVAEQLLTAAMPLTEETRQEAAVYYAFLARARVSPSFRAVADTVDDDLRRLHALVVRLALPDAPDPHREAAVRELQALSEGLAFQLVTWPHRYSVEDARAAVRTWIDRTAAPAGRSSSGE